MTQTDSMPPVQSNALRAEDGSRYGGGIGAPGLGNLLSQPLMAGLLLAAVTLLAYWPVQHCDFISLDDPLFITRNFHVQAGLSPSSVLWAFTARTGALWHPLTWLTYLVDVELFGHDPTGPHIINLFWHVANAVLLFGFLRQITGAHWRSLFVAALFALHPLHVESVAWLSERKDVLSTFFGLLSLWAYSKYVSCPRLSAGLETSDKLQAPSSKLPINVKHPAPSALCERSAVRFYLLSLFCFVLGLMSKPMVVTVPFLFLLLDFWPLGRIPGAGRPAAAALRPLLWEKLPFFAAAAAACWVTLSAQSEGGALQPLTNTPFDLRLGNALVSYASYVGHLFWPADLAVPYPAAPAWPLATIAYAAAVLVGVSATAVWLGRQAPFVSVGWFWYLGTLVPVIGLVQVGEQAMADRYTYLPAIGLFLVLSWGAGALLAQWPGLKRSAALLALAIMAACAGLTRHQLSFWQNSETLFTHTLAVTRDNWMACFALGSHLAEKGRPDEAIAMYRRALAVQPGSTEVLNNLGNALVTRELFPEALKCYQTALSFRPDKAELHSNLGAALEKLGRTEEALSHYNRALELAPDSALTHFRLANTLARLGRGEEAVAQYLLALRDRPDYTQAYNNLGVALFNQGRIQEATEQFSLALRQNPEDAETRGNLANALAAQKKWAEAAEQYAEALRLKPELGEAKYGLARALAQMGRREEAIQLLKELLQATPDHVLAKQLLQALEGSGAR